jgi:hypothetical protein
MADLAITAANVISGAGARIDRKRTAAVAITAGQWVYRDGDQYKLADCNSATAAARVPDGIALNGAAAGQPLAVQTGGDITIGATLTPGTTYYLSGTAGGTRPGTDNTTGDYPCVVGIARSASLLRIGINAAAAAL